MTHDNEEPSAASAGSAGVSYGKDDAKRRIANMSDDAITAGNCVTYHAMRVDDGGEQCIRCRALADVLHVGFLCGKCRDAGLQASEQTSNGRTPMRNAMSGWIPVSDRLPKFVDILPNGERFSRPVLVAIEATDDVMIGTYGDQMGWMVGSDCMNTTITHWMPLPEPPTDAK